MCKKAEKHSYLPDRYFFTAVGTKSAREGTLARLLHPTEEIKSSAEVRLICQAEKRKPRGRGIPESSRQGTVMR